MTPSHPAQTACKVCGAQTRFVLSAPNEHRSPPTLETRRCPRCGLVQVATPVTQRDLELAYAAMGPQTYYQETAEASREKFQKAADELLRLAALGPQARLLDVGCGNGEFLDVLRRRGIDASHLAGQELPGESARLARSRGFAVHEQPFEELARDGPESFDVVALMDVAEHVADPLALFEACWRLLKPGGLLYAHTPCVSRLDRLMHAVARWPVLGGVARLWQRTRTSIFHLQNFTPASLRLCLRRFEKIEVAVRNELSWPLALYARIYVCERIGLPARLAPVLALLLRPILHSRRLNANKGVVRARKPGP